MDRLGMAHVRDDNDDKLLEELSEQSDVSITELRREAEAYPDLKVTEIVLRTLDEIAGVAPERV